MKNDNEIAIKYGYLASRVGIELVLQVLSSNDGFYIGTWQNGPFTRESDEYYPDFSSAQEALTENNWTQYEYP